MAITLDAAHLKLAKTGLAYFGSALVLYWLLKVLNAFFTIFVQPGKSVRMISLSF